MAQTTQTLSASGTYDLTGFGSGTPLIQVKGASWSGLIVFKVNTAPAGKAVSYQTVPVRVRGEESDRAAGTAFGWDGAFEVKSGGLPAVAVYTHTAGTVTLVTIENCTPTADPTTVTLANLDLSDGIPIHYPEELAFQFELAKDAAP